MFKLNKKTLAGVSLVLVTLIAIVAPDVSAQDPSHGKDAPAAEDNVYAQTYNAVSPSVVAISVILPDEQAHPNGFFFGQPPHGALGSGFVIDTEGHIVTNAHVVKDAPSIEVSFFDGTLARAKAVGIDIDSDIAVIKVDLPAEKLHPVTFGNSDDLFIGQSVLAIGSPFGERWTLTSGIVSGLGRVING